MKTLKNNPLTMICLCVCLCAAALIAFVTVYAAPAPSTIQACYDNANGLVFVTAIVGINAGRTNTNPNSSMNLTYTGSASFGTCPAGRWIVAGGDIATGAQFNVMVVGP